MPNRKYCRRSVVAALRWSQTRRETQIEGGWDDSDRTVLTMAGSQVFPGYGHSAVTSAVSGEVPALGETVPAET